MPIIIVMSLSFDDFQTIRTIMREELDEKLTPVEKRAEALEGDVKDIYFIISDIQKDSPNYRKT